MFSMMTYASHSIWNAAITYYLLVPLLAFYKIKKKQ